MKQFDFGQNWQDFSESKLDDEHVEQARLHFHELLEGVDIKGKTFLDIGFGQGLSLLIAHLEGARVAGMDINPKCAQVVERNKQFLDVDDDIETVVGSVLEPDDLAKLKDRRFDVVHSWGVLHHTGNMEKAIANACQFVNPGGLLVLAIYNRHWSSLPWLVIKWIYCHAPSFLQKLMIGLFYPIILLAKLLVTGQSPFRMSRGMDFYYNVVDWVGGYPYEYASVDEMVFLMEKHDFVPIKTIAAKVPTGCNEFVFQRKSSQSHV